MPLSIVVLEEQLTSLFEEPPSTATDCAQAWVDAIGTYASTMVPTTTTLTAALTSLSVSLAGTFAKEEHSTSISEMELAFAAFALSVAGGITGGIPPAGLVGFATLNTAETTHAAAANKFATAIDTWMKTGQQTVGSTTIFWS